MIERLAVDSNVVIDLIRKGGPVPPGLLEPGEVLLPLPVLGELLAGAYSSTRSDENLRAIETVVRNWAVLEPKLETAHHYGRLRGLFREMPRATQARINDLWIAALCLQHNLPLLTNDRGFDIIPGLAVLHW